MAIRVKLGRFERAEQDPLGRAHTGWFPRMTEQEIWAAGRGLWRLNQNIAGRERFALIVTPEGQVGAAARITSITAHGDRKALDGEVLDVGHPLRDAYVGHADPLANGSQNRITYGVLPEETALRDLTCACGCGAGTTAEFVSGHDVRAIRSRVHEHFAGSTADFLTWLDDTLPGRSTNTSSRAR